MRPAAAGARSGDPEEMSLADLDYFIDNSGFGIRPAWVYETWWHKRLSLFFSALVMIAICIPLAVRFRRGGGIGVAVRRRRRHRFSLFRHRRHRADHGRAWVSSCRGSPPGCRSWVSRALAAAIGSPAPNAV